MSALRLAGTSHPYVAAPAAASAWDWGRHLAVPPLREEGDAMACCSPVASSSGDGVVAVIVVVVAVVVAVAVAVVVAAVSDAALFPVPMTGILGEMLSSADSG